MTDKQLQSELNITSDQTQRKHIRVVGAAIVQHDHILCAKRPADKQLGGYWEFPGGKIEPDETAHEALHREIHEELLCDIVIGEQVSQATYEYEFGTIELTIFVCRLKHPNMQPTKTEHQELRWVAPEDMPQLKWAPADADAVTKLSKMYF